MYLSTQKRFAIFAALILATFAAAFLLLSMVFHIDSAWPWAVLISILAAPLFYMRVFQLSYVKWKDSYYVGVEEIDYDHKQLVGMINQVVTASQDHLAENIVPEILDKLIDYTKYHLEREEKLMEQYDYPVKEQHAIQHAKFIDKINRFYSKFSEERNMKNQEVFDFLRCWLLKHISSTDKDLGAFIQAKRNAQVEG